jgi:type IV secretion system protein TrbD
MPLMADYEPRVTPLRRSLVEPQLIAGVEKPFAVVNATLATVFVADLHIYSYIAIAVSIHILLRRITKADPFMRRIYIKYNLQADAYDPWPHVRQRRNWRPSGFGRGMLC